MKGRPPRIARLDELPEEWRGAVIAIGNFDGVHRGHQAVLDAALREAEHRGVAAIMLTLEPHPRAFFSSRPLFRLSPAPLKAALAGALGFAGTLVLDFDETLAGMSAEDFVSEILAKRLDIKAAVTGYDFQFGKARRGTPDFLVNQGLLHGFSVTVVDALVDEEDAVSSTRIRAALATGDVATANALLGWHFAVAGEILRGEARGRQLGFPTANMSLDPAVELAHGIYATRFLRKDGGLFDGIANYGRRPTFGGGKPLFETFLFDFSGDLYGETALVALYGFIRREERFATVPELVTRMDQDAIDARLILERTPPGVLDERLYGTWPAQAPSPSPLRGGGRPRSGLGEG